MQFYSNSRSSTLHFVWIYFFTTLFPFFVTIIRAESQTKEFGGITSENFNSLAAVSSVRTSDTNFEDGGGSLHENSPQGREDNDFNQLKYVWGDALDNPTAKGPDGKPYPWELASQFVSKQRNPRSFMFSDEKTEPQLISPQETRKILLSAFETGEAGLDDHRQGRSKKVSEPQGCVPSRLCQSTLSVSAPLYGVSLTSGRPVTIVQKFPDLLQQVVFQVCKSTECDVLHGVCVQTYLPYLFLVIPLGPVTLTGQDYILVESGCVCQPKYARRDDNPPPLPFIQAINSTRHT